MSGRKKLPWSPLGQNVALSKLYNKLLEHVREENFINKPILTYYLEMLNQTPVENCESLWIVNKIKGLLQYAVKSSNAFNKSLIEGKVVIMESICQNFHVHELRGVYQELLRYLKIKPKFLPREKLEYDLKNFSRPYKCEGEKLELLIRIKEILTYLLEKHAETADITFHSPAKKTETRDQMFLRNEILPDKLSKNNNNSKEDIETQHFFNNTETYQEPFQENSQNDNIFQNTVLPFIKSAKQNHANNLGKANERLLIEVISDDIKMGKTTLSNKTFSTDTSTVNTFNITEALHQESQHNYDMLKSVMTESENSQFVLEPNSISAVSFDIYENLEKIYDENYKLALNLKSIQSEVEIDKNLTSSSIIFEEYKPFKNKFQAGTASLETAAKRGFYYN